MSLYSVSDADYLIGYYSKLVIGKPIEASMPSKIKKVDKEDYGLGKYRVNAYAISETVLQLRRSIDKVAFDLNLPSPDEVLKNREQ
jgi:hypothetical protein